MWDLKPFEMENLCQARNGLMDNQLKIYATQIKICESSLRPEVQIGSGESEVVHFFILQCRCKM